MHYYFQRVLNNNAIVATKDYKAEVILMGKAIGVKCKRNSLFPVNPSLIERVFENIQDGNWKYIEQLINGIPYEYFALIDEVVKNAGEELDYDFKDQLTLTLLDHIFFSVERFRENEIIPNPLLKEIQQFYSKEYRVAERSVELINRTLHVDLDENDASFIAFHYINAMSRTKQGNNKKIAKALSECVEIVETYFDIHLNRDSYYFYRFITHIKYFLERLLNGDYARDGEAVLSNFIRQQYKNEWLCAESIKDHLTNKLDKEITDDELAYLALHIATMMKSNER